MLISPCEEGGGSLLLLNKEEFVGGVPFDLRPPTKSVVLESPIVEEQQMRKGWGIWPHIPS